MSRYGYKGRHHKQRTTGRHRAPVKPAFMLGLPSGFGSTGMVGTHRRTPRLFGR